MDGVVETSRGGDGRQGAAAGRWRRGEPVGRAWRQERERAIGTSVEAGRERAAVLVRGPVGVIAGLAVGSSAVFGRGCGCARVCPRARTIRLGSRRIDMGTNSASSGGGGEERRVRRITREDVMTAREVAHMLVLPKSTVYELARRGELPCARLGRTIRFIRDDVEARLRTR